MSRYIDADRLMDYCHNMKDRTIDCNDIARLPSIDIVRCKDCKYWEGSQKYPYCRCSVIYDDMSADDYCSYGERIGDTNGE